MRSPRSPHSVHGLPTCIWTRDAGVIAIVRAKFVILGALSPGQKWRLYFRGFPPGFPSFFPPTRTILREFWAFRRPRERGPSLDDLPPPFSLSPLFLPFFSLSSPPSATAGKKLPFFAVPMLGRRQKFHGGIFAERNRPVERNPVPVLQRLRRWAP